VNEVEEEFAILNSFLDFFAPVLRALAGVNGVDGFAFHMRKRTCLEYQ